MVMGVRIVKNINCKINRQKKCMKLLNPGLLNTYNGKYSIIILY